MSGGVRIRQGKDEEQAEVREPKGRRVGGRLALTLKGRGVEHLVCLLCNIGMPVESRDSNTPAIVSMVPHNTVLDTASRAWPAREAPSQA